MTPDLKTTLLNLVSSLLKPDNGKIEIDGKIYLIKNNIFVDTRSIYFAGTIFENIVISGNSKKLKSLN